MRCVLKEVISYKNFCDERKLSQMSPNSQAEYRLYLNEVEKENRPALDEIRRKAQEVKKELFIKYKRHYWPDNPFEAIATSKTKKHMMKKQMD